MHYTIDFIDSLGLDENICRELLEHIRQKNVTGINKIIETAGIDGRNAEILSGIPFLYGEMSKTLKKARTMAVNEKMEKDLDELQEYCSALKSLGYAKNVQIDLSMINDMEYYNGIVFRGYIRNLPGCVLAGGQYDKAMQLFGKDAGAVGFAIYLDELTKGRMPASEYDVDALLIYDAETPAADVFKAVKSLQKEGLTVRAETEAPACLRYREKYILENGETKKEEI